LGIMGTQVAQPEMKEVLANSWRLAKEVVGTTFYSFKEHDNALRAAALAYHALLSLFPLILFLIFLGSRLMVSGTARLGLEYYLEQTLPAVADTLKEVIEQTIEAQGAIGLIGGLALLWSASAVFTVLEAALNTIWGASHRPFWLRRLLGAASVLALSIIFMASLALTALPAWALPAPGTALARWLNSGLELGLVVLFAWLLYRLLPNCNVSWRASLAGAVLAGLLWQAARTAFSGYLPFAMTRYGLVYGSLAWIVALALFAYLSSLILFLGAEFGATFQKKVLTERESKRDCARD